MPSNVAPASGDPATEPAEDELDVDPAVSDGTPDGESPAESDDPALFKEEDLKTLPEGDAKRVRGFQSTFTKAQQDLKRRQKETDELNGKLREQLELLAAAQGSDDPPTASTAIKSRMQSLLEKAAPGDRETLKELAEAIREDMRSEFAPVTESITQTRLNVEIEAARQRHPDFDSVMRSQSVQALVRRHPEIASPELAYRILKFEQLEHDNKTQGSELARILEQKKRAAQTETPGGPSGDMVDTDWFNRLSKEKRKAMTTAQLFDLTERNKEKGSR